MGTYSDDRRRVDRLEPEIKMLLGQYFIRTSTAEQDKREATDLVLIMQPQQVRIGCRVRRHAYWTARDGEYRNQFTIRAGRPNGKPTEYQKIMGGWGDCLFYGFADPTDQWMYHATLIDLSVFRVCIHEHKIQPRNDQGNHDGSSTFYAFDIDDFHPAMILQTWHWYGESHKQPETARQAFLV